MMPRTAITGGCQCGAVRYRSSAPLGRASICHCRMCQKAFGSFFGPLVSVPLEAFEVTRGEVAIFRSSDMAERGFCRDCGTPLSFRFRDSDAIDVSIGSLDDPAAARPTVQLGIEARLPWFADLAALPEHATKDGDPPGVIARIARSNRQHPDRDTDAWPPEGHPA